MADIPPGANKFKDRILDIFKRAEALGLCLQDNKEKALIDYLACYPSMASRIVTTSNVQRGFYANGMLSKETPDDKYAYPCFDGLLATCKKEMPTGLYDKCRDILPRAFDQATQFGEVQEELYDEFDIPVDRDIYGVAKPKYLSPQQLCQSVLSVSPTKHCWMPRMQLWTKQLPNRMQSWQRIWTSTLSSGIGMIRLLLFFTKNSMPRRTSLSLLLSSLGFKS
jgi:hypothetical protein